MAQSRWSVGTGVDRAVVGFLRPAEPGPAATRAGGEVSGTEVPSTAGTAGLPTASLHAAARCNLPDLAMALLAAGANPGMPGELGGTPLHWACWYGHAGVVRVLLAHDPCVNLRCGAFQALPLHWAMHGSRFFGNPDGDYPRTVALLLAAGASAPREADVCGSEAVQEVLRAYAGRV